MHEGAIDWLLEEDEANPGVRYRALRELVDLPETSRQVRQARRAIMRTGPVPTILASQAPEGFWVKPGAGYSPKYQGTTWSMLILAELGADGKDPAIRAGARYVLEHSRASSGAFAARQPPSPGATYHCLNGNMLFALTRLGLGDDPQVQQAFDWLARSILGEDPISYYASGNAAPGFACGVNMGQPCAWGANKALRALLELPPASRSPRVKRAIQAACEFLLSRDPLAADYPYTKRVSSTWFKLGFPMSYWSDVLETVANLAKAGFGGDRRLAAALDWVMAKRRRDGRWKLENSLNGKMWTDLEKRGQPSKWITLRALTALKAAGLYTPKR